LQLAVLYICFWNSCIKNTRRYNLTVRKQSLLFLLRVACKHGCFLHFYNIDKRVHKLIKFMLFAICVIKFLRNTLSFSLHKIAEQTVRDSSEYARHFKDSRLKKILSATELNYKQKWLQNFMLCVWLKQMLSNMIKGVL
jgi:hypothetical protein